LIVELPLDSRALSPMSKNAAPRSLLAAIAVLPVPCPDTSLTEKLILPLRSISTDFAIPTPLTGVVEVDMGLFGRSLSSLHQQSCLEDGDESTVILAFIRRLIKYDNFLVAHHFETVDRELANSKKTQNPRGKRQNPF
jgi:hypothetical protein